MPPVSLTTHAPDGAVAAAKVAPAAVYAATYAGGWTISEWAAAAALLYSLLMIGDWIARRVVIPLLRRRAED